jgi:hypothetical protein
MDQDEDWVACALGDFEKAKQIASRFKSFEDISALAAEGALNNVPDRVSYWAVLYYGLVNNDRAAYTLVQMSQPRLAKEFDSLVRALEKQDIAISRSNEAPIADYRTAPQETAYCFKTALDIGRTAESVGDIRAAIPLNLSDVIKEKILIWSSLCLCFMKNTPDLYNDIRREFPLLVSEFEYWGERVLMSSEEPERGDTETSLAELKELGFNVDSEMIETIRHFRRLSLPENGTIH